MAVNHNRISLARDTNCYVLACNIRTEIQVSVYNLDLRGRNYKLKLISTLFAVLSHGTSSYLCCFRCRLPLRADLVLGQSGLHLLFHAGLGLGRDILLKVMLPPRLAKACSTESMGSLHISNSMGFWPLALAFCPSRIHVHIMAFASL
jgi:hypothetical protein